MERLNGTQEGALVLNVFGGPGAGKTTIASKIFSELKSRGIESACPEEHAKLAILSGRSWMLDHQVIIAGKTWETLITLHDKVSVIVVDSPILLCSVYAGNREPAAFHELIRDLHRRTPRVNLFVERGHDAIYDPRNRRENALEAASVDTRAQEMLHWIGEVPTVISSRANPDEIAERVIALL